MISNHNQNMSSFRIIEPKPYQQAQQVPLNAVQQVPILSNSIMTSNGSSSWMNGGAGTSGCISSGIGAGTSSLTNNNNEIINANNQSLQQSSISMTNSLSHQQLYQHQQQMLVNQQAAQSANSMLHLQHFHQVPQLNNHISAAAASGNHHSLSAMHLQTQRIRNLSDTDSSCIPGNTFFSFY